MIISPAYAWLFPGYRCYALHVVGIASLLTVALLLVFMPIRPLVALIGLTTALLMLLARPWLVWVAFGLLLPASSAIAIGPLHLSDLILAGALGLWFIDGVRCRDLAVRPTWLLVPISFFTGILYLSMLQATNLSEAATELLKWVQFAFILLIVPAALPRHGVQWLLIGLLLGGAGQALLGIYQFIFQIGPEWFIIMGRFMRASGSFNQPNPFGGYLGLSLPIALSLTLWAGHRLWQQRRHPGVGLLLLTLFYAATTGLIALGLLASWSRGGWLGAAGSTAVVVLLRSRRSLLWGGVAALLLLIALLLGAIEPRAIPAPIAARFQEIPAYLGFTDLLSRPVTDENFAILERLAHWDAALRMWERAPWLGIGPGNYATIYPEVRLPRWEEALGHAHNIYLNTLAESGLWGLFAYLFLWGSILIRLWCSRQHTDPLEGDPQGYKGEDWMTALLIGVIGMVCHLSIHNFFDNLFVQGIYLHIALWLAAVERLTANPRVPFGPPSTANREKARASLLGAGRGALGALPLR